MAGLCGSAPMLAEWTECPLIESLHNVTSDSIAQGDFHSALTIGHGASYCRGVMVSPSTAATI